MRTEHITNLEEMNSQVLVCLSFIVFFDITMSADFIQQVPPGRISRDVGQSASIQCSVAEKSKVDIRELGLNKRKSQIFTLWINNDTLSNNLQVFGTYNSFTWILNQEGGGTIPCTTAGSVDSSFACRGPDAKTSKIYLSDGGEDVASLSVDSSLDYRSRIQLSGTIRNLTITLTGLSESDRDCYTCYGTAKNIVEDSVGAETCLIVVKGTDEKLSPGAIAGIVICVLTFTIPVALFLCFRKKKKMKKNEEEVRPVENEEEVLRYKKSDI